MHGVSAEKKQKKNGLGHHFLPVRFQKAHILKWLKRVHAWTGLWGALLFLLIGMSGFLLNHRSVMKIDTGSATTVANMEVAVDDTAITSGRELQNWVQTNFNVSADKSQIRARLRKKARFNGQELVRPAKWEVTFRGPNGRLRARYVEGSGIVELKENTNNLLGTLKNMHKGTGLGVAWVLFFDTLAGALIFMSLTGILLWSKLHGPRLAGAGLMVGSILAATAAAFPFFMGSSL